jgi:hypothetical protein
MYDRPVTALILHLTRPPKSVSRSVIDESRDLAPRKNSPIHTEKFHPRGVDLVGPVIERCDKEPARL